MMGKNTRALLKGVTTVKGYENRIGKILALPMDERSQSNGALMRCSSLALIWDNQPVVIDASITNPTNVVIDCNLVYISALRLALEGEQGPVIFEKVLPIAQTKEVKEVLAQVQARQLRDIKSNKGWCLHGLWCAMMAITSFTSYTEAMRWIITSQIGSDTDTNACIAGALLGAILGFDAIRAEPDMEYNISVILSDNSMKGPTPRPVEYGISDFYELTAKAAMFLNH
jgi:ADP-ribosylglycohydrolase